MEKSAILTITGSDGTGESGVQADVRTISALGSHAVSVLTSITVQNTLGIQCFYDIPGNVVAAQLEAIINDVQPSVMKIGMIRNVETLNVLVRTIVKYKPSHVVYDPVISSFLNEELMSRDVVFQIRSCLLPLCSLIIIRRSEADRLLGGCSFPNIYFIDDRGRHGLRNVFASAAAVFLQRGYPNEEAVQQAREYVEHLMIAPSPLSGRSQELYHEFMQLVRQNYSSNSDVLFYANCMNVSTRYLAQVCKRVAAKSPKAIIDDYIVNQIAMALGSEPTKTIQQLAYVFGFSNQAHFSKFFRKLRGVSPSEFRKQQQIK